MTATAPNDPNIETVSETTTEEDVLLAIDTDVIDALILRTLSQSAASNAKLEDVIQFGRLLMERRRVGPFSPAMKAALLDAIQNPPTPAP